MQHVHILGICGTAMAAIAKLARDSGFRVTGSDAGVYPPMSDFLAAEGIIAHEGYAAEHLQPAPDLVVIGNAMSRGNPEVEYVLNQGLAYCSGPEFIGSRLLPGRHACVVAGTHGKTSTSSLLAHVLAEGQMQPGFMIGGIPENFGTGARLGEGSPFVLEGDEYDTAFFDKRSKFLHYHARTLILNNLEYDHADIFPNLDAIKTQFHHLIRTVPANGLIICNADEPSLADVLSRGCWTDVVHFGEVGCSEAEWQWQALNEDGSAFRLLKHQALFLECHWTMLGKHQIGNACAVAAAANSLGMSAGTIQAAFESFLGIRRRLTLTGSARGISVYDDFAHHPTAIRGVVNAMAARTEGHRLWVLLEPRSNTMRTRIHEQALPDSLAKADEVIFAPPSSRNLQADEVLDVASVCRHIGPHARVLPDTTSIIDAVCQQATSGDHVLILSNGGFDGIHQKLLHALQQQET